MRRQRNCDERISPMTFTEEAVEAAAKAIFNRNIYHGYNEETKRMQWMLQERSLKGDARAALTAASAVMANTQKKDER